MSTKNDTNPDLKTPDEWCGIQGVQILDPDGWRGRHGRPWTDPISLAEFRERLATCTQRSTPAEPEAGPRTAADFIREAARYVNWKPDDKHSQQARYDALRALNGIHAYSTAVALETLRRIDPAAAERVAQHLARDDWDAYFENAWTWHEELSNGRPIDPNDCVFKKLTGQTEEAQA